MNWARKGEAKAGAQKPLDPERLLYTVGKALGQDNRRVIRDQ